MPVKLPTADNLGDVRLGGARRVINMQAPANPFGGIAKGFGAVADFGQVKMEQQAKLRAEQEKADIDFEDHQATLRSIAGGDKFSAEVEKLNPLDPEYDKKVSVAYKKNVTDHVMGGIRHPSVGKKWYQATQQNQLETTVKARESQRKAVYDDNTNKLMDGIKSVYAKTAVDPNGDPEQGRSVAIDLIRKSHLSQADKDKLERELGKNFDQASVLRSLENYSKTGIAVAPEISAAVKAMAEQTGQDWFAGYAARVATLESSGGTNLVNKESSARGVWQFTEETGKLYGLKTEADRMDPVKSTMAMYEFTMDNYNTLKSRLGREPTPAEMYLAHQQGAMGALKILENPEAKATDIVGEDAVKLNLPEELRAKAGEITAGQFLELWQDKFDNGRVEDFETIRGALSTVPAFGRLDVETQYSTAKQAQTYIREERKLKAQQKKEQTHEAVRLGNSDIASIMETGKPAEGVDPAALKASMTEKQYADYARKRNNAGAIWNATRNFDQMPNRDLEELTGEKSPIRPTPGSPNYADEQLVFEAVQKKVAEKQAARKADPSGEAMKHPAVQKAYEEYMTAARADSNPNQDREARVGKAFRAYLAATTEVQFGFGVPKQAAALVPDADAEAIGRLFLDLPLDIRAKDANISARDTLSRVYAELKLSFGDQTDEVIAYSLAKTKPLSRDTTKTMVGLLTALTNGKEIRRSARATAQSLMEVDRADSGLLGFFDLFTPDTSAQPAPASTGSAYFVDEPMDGSADAGDGATNEDIR